MKLKRLLWLLISVSTLIVWLNKELINYSWIQGKGQLEVLWKARPIEDLITENKLPDSLKIKLKLVEKLTEFADSIGLEVNESYSKIYNQQGKPILWNVSACKPYAFDSYKWKFPLLGTFSYKGFFQKDMADRLVIDLKTQGYDVNIRTVGAWSTLGWFNDPLLSNQLYLPVGNLAETIFHELTHATIFFEDSLTYNENPATFLGEKLTNLFLERHFGTESSERNKYWQNKIDSRLFRTHMLRGKDKLDSLYQTFEENMSADQKAILKERIITSIIQSLDSVTFSNERYKFIFSTGRELNNAYLMGFSRYYNHQEQLDSMLMKQNGHLAAWIQSLKLTAN